MRGWLWTGGLAWVMACSSFHGEEPSTGSNGPVDAGVDGAGPGPVTGSQGDYGLSITPVPGTISFLPGQTATAKITIVRGAKQTAEVRLTVNGLPAGFAPVGVTIPGDASTADLPIVVPATPTPGALNTQILATAVTTDPSTAASAVTSLQALVHGKPGDPDLTFGTSGQATSLLASVVQLLSAPDGSLFVIGSQTSGPGPIAAVSHLTADGKADAGYGNAGAGTIASISATAGALQKDGKVVIVGAGPSTAAMARLDARGKPDLGFTAQDIGTGAGSVGTAGLAGTNAKNYGVAVRDSDGAIFVVFKSSLPDSYSPWLGQLRFDSNGALHTAYGSGGGVQHLKGATFSGVLVRNRAASPSLGAVTVVGFERGNDLGFTQQTGDDAPDPAAGTQPKHPAGSVPSLYGPDSNGLVELADGSIVAAVNNQVDGSSFFLRKLDPFGDPPATTFGVAGVAGKFGAAPALGMAAQPDGKLLVLTTQGVLHRFSEDGTVDTGFGSGGSISLPANPYPAAVVAGADRIIVGANGTLTSFWQ